MFSSKFNFLRTIAAAAYLQMFAVAEGAAEAKKPKFCEKSFEELDDGSLTGIVQFVFGNGKELSLDVFKLPDEMQQRLKIHGALQKIGDSYASVKGDYAEGIAKAEAVIEQLVSGAWRGERGEAGPRLGELAAAIARIKGAELEVVRTAVEKATDEQRKAWRSNAKVKATIAQIRAEEAAKALEAAGEQSLEISLA